MKNIIYFCLMMSVIANAQVKNLTQNSTYYDFVNGYKTQNTDTVVNKQIERMNRMWIKKLSPNGDCKIAANALQEYAQNYDQYSTNNYNPNWLELGPIGTTSTSQIQNGQIHNIIFNPNYDGINNQTIYATSSYGGLWRSENDGFLWQNVNTDTGLPLNSISDLAIHPTNPNVLFIATGIADNGNVHFVTRAGHTNPTFSIGVYRSLDYGATWHPINSGLENDLIERMNIREIEINPENPNQLFIATDAGVFRTNNANDTIPIWTEQLNTNRTDQIFDTEFKGLEFKPNNPNTVYVSGQNIYKSIDSGDTWLSMTGVGTGLDLDNLSNDFQVFRINITVTPAANENVYAYIYGKENDGEGIARIYIYMFNGSNWILLQSFITTDGTQPPEYEVITWTRLAIAVSPTDANAVYYGTTKLYGDNDISTLSFTAMSPYGGSGTGGYHADIHSLEFPPNNGTQLFCGNDGGISLKTLPSTSTGNWQSRNNGLGVSTLWSFDDSDNNENYLLCGFQDNFTKRLLNNQWSRIFGGDGYGAQINDFNDDNAFFISNKSLYRYGYNIGGSNGQLNAECTPNTLQRGIFDNRVQNNDYRPWDSQGDTFRSWLTIDFEIKNDQKTGEMYWTFGEIYKRNIDKDVPLPEDRDNPNNLWQRQSNVFELGVLPDDNSFPSWRRQINRFEISEADSNYRYLVRPGADLAGTEELYTPPLKSFIYKDDNANGLYEELTTRPGGDDEDFPLVSDIVIDPTNPQRIFISYTSFIRDYKVWYSEDAGITWFNLDLNNKLPNVPINAITYQKGSNDILYVGTDVGVYVKEGIDADWQKYGDFPNVNVQDLKINYCNNKLRVATYGRGMWEGDILPYNKELPEVVFNAGENVIWETDVQRGLRNSVRIKSGATLTIKSELSMPEKAKITVEKGGKLILDGAKLSQNCGLIWQGITIKGNPNVPQTEANQGVLEMINGATIEYAEIGVLAANASFNRTDDNSGTGIIKIDNAIFRDNIVGIEIPKYNFANHSYIKNSTFETTDFLANANRVFRNFVSLSEVGAIEISNNQFKNLVPIDPNISPESFRNQGRGIVTFNSKTEIYNNNFENLYKAIQVEGTFSGACLTRECINTDIYTNTFTNNFNAIQLNSTKNATIISNDINVFPYMQNGGVSSSSGMYITNSKAFHIEGNDIFANITAFTNGIFIRDCNSINEIYKNDFQKLYTAIYAYGNNRNPNEKQGLQILCNAFTDNSNDIYIAPNSIFSTEVGSAGQSAGNTFLPVCNSATESARQFNNLGANNITYLGTESPEYLPRCNYNLNVVSVAQQNTCPDLITRVGTLEELAAFDNDIADKKSILLALTDGGDTEALTETVEETEENQALKLRNNLLRKSPTLSDTVMVSSTFKEEVLPSIMLKQVLAANPKAAKSTKVQNALDDRTNLLPEYMREEINLGKNTMSFIET